MLDNLHPRRPRNVYAQALIEVGFIIFLFYSNLLMGEFNVTSGRGKTIIFALHDIFTRKNFLIGIAAALVGHLLFGYLRRNS